MVSVCRGSVIGRAALRAARANPAAGVPEAERDEGHRSEADVGRRQGFETSGGNGPIPNRQSAAANSWDARCVLVAITDGFEGGQVFEQGAADQSRLRSSRSAQFGGRDRDLKRHGDSNGDHGRVLCI